MCAAANHIMVTTPMKFHLNMSGFDVSVRWFLGPCQSCSLCSIGRCVEFLWKSISTTKAARRWNDCAWRGLDWFGFAWLTMIFFGRSKSFHSLRFALLCFVLHTLFKQKIKQPLWTMALPLIKILPIIARDRLELHFKIKFEMKFSKRDHSFSTIFTIWTEHKLSFTVNVPATLEYLGPESYLIRFDVCAVWMRPLFNQIL